MTDAAGLRRALLFALIAGLLMFLFFQPGNPYDEAEHLHAAWLMSARGLRPIHDFFEHHPPLLWFALSPLFHLARGPEVLYLARLFVLACAGLWMLALRRSALALSLFAVTLVLAQQLFVTRPETLATALLALALICWRLGPLPASAVAGAAAALSACASPRFLLLAPALLLVRAPTPRSTAAAAAGAAAALAGFIAFACPWQDFVFDLRFSQLLQHVGYPPEVFSLVYLASSAAVSALVCGMLLSVRQAPRRAAALWIAHGLLIWTACFVSAGRFLYAQAFAPALLWGTLFAAWLDGLPASPGAAEAPLVLSALLGSLAALAMQVAGASLNPYNVPSLTASRRMLLDALPAQGARVLLLPDSHPLTADDASYFGTVPSSSICDAAQAYPRAFPASPVHIPTCDFVGDLQRQKPDAISRNLFMAAPPLQIDELRALIAARYALTETLDDAPVRDYPANVMFRDR